VIYNNPAEKANPNFVASGDIFGTRVFVENKGQFDQKAVTGDKILYAFDHGQEKVYFTTKGLIYEMIKSFPLTEKQTEEMEEGKNVQFRPEEAHMVYMNWVGNVTGKATIESSQKQSHYITYGEVSLNSNTFKKITYKNVYPGIDIEYSIPEEKTHGLKYSVILHPGADPSHMQIFYSGEVDKIKKKKSGEILINTGLYDLVEHLPEAFYDNGEKISSDFTLKHDTIGFIFPNGFDSARTVVIDPWIATVTTLTANNLAYDVDFDFGGNMFIFGSFGYAKVAMYNAAGILQWTFSGMVTSQNWTSQIGSLSGSVGSFAVDKFSGKAYVGQGANFPRVVRLDVLGNYDNYITPTNNLFQELWEMGFGCFSGDILIVGGGHTSNQSAATINTFTPALILSSFNPTNTAFVHDISAFCQDDLGNTFAYYACSNTALNHKITRVNLTFNGPVWTMPSGFNAYQEINNKSNYGGGSIPSAGYNGLYANNFYLYYYDGANLAAFDKTTGTVIATIATGNPVKSVGGIMADDCNKIYVGGNGIIQCYSFNGTSFSTLTPISLSVTTTLQRVYDIRLNRSTGMLYVSGSAFCGVYQAVYSNTCGVGLGLCIFSQPGIAASTTSITCATLGSATVTPNNGIGPYSYTWVPSNQTGSVGVGLSPGQYTIVVYDAGYNMTYTTTTTFLPAVPLTASMSASSILSCYGATNGSMAITNISGGSAVQNYSWTNGVNTWTTLAVTGVGAGSYTLKIVDALTGCIFSPTFSIVSPSQLNSLIMVSSPTACVNDPITLSGITGGGVPGYTYSWTAGPTTNTSAVTQTLAGPYTYSLESRDQNNCPIYSQATVTFIARPNLGVSSASICPFETGTITAAGATTYTWYGGAGPVSYGSSFSDNPVSSSIYTVVGSALGCTSSASAFITVKPVPLPNIVSNSPVCNGQMLTVGVTGGTAALWTGPLGYTASLISWGLMNAYPAQSGMYNTTITALNSCTAAVSLSLTVHPSPTVSATGATVCSNQPVNLYANAGSAISFAWSGVGGYTTLIQNPVISNPVSGMSGNYTVVATSSAGCSNFALAHVTVTTLPQTFPNNDGPKCDGTQLSLNGSNTFGGISYSWNGPNNFSSTLMNPVIAAVSLGSAGIYTVFVTAGPCVRSNTTQVTIWSLPSPAASYNGPVCEKSTLNLTVTTPASNSIITYAWQGPGFSSPQQNPIRYNSKQNYSGLYNVWVTDINGCINQASVNVNILINPVVTAKGDSVCIYDPAQLIAGGAATYSWSGITGLVGTQPVYQVASAANVLPLTFTVLGTALNTCTGNTTAQLVTFPLPNVTAKVGPTAIGCEGTNFSFEALGANVYNWNGPGSFKAYGETFTLSTASLGHSGVYKVIGADLHGCKSSNTVSILVHHLPSAGLSGGPFEACVPFCGFYDFIQYSNESPITAATWMVNRSYMSGKSFFYCFSSEGQYIFEGSFTDKNGCSNTATVLVTGFQKPVADFNVTPERPVENGDPVQFIDNSFGDNINKWSWFLDDPSKERPIKLSTQNAFYDFDNAGIYALALVVKNERGCSDTVTKSIRIEEDFLVFVPNAFTPNSDSRNERFSPVLRGQKFLRMQIFNRWGEMIFETRSLENGWDGTFRGEACKQDAYVWKLSISSKSGISRELTGEVNLLR
jgi:gliding motility-associated-like protein